MRRIGFALLASVALIGGAAAADMPVKAPVYKAPVIAPPYNWTGFYVGGHIGGAWSNVDISDPTGAVFAPLGATIGADGNGFLGGGQIGFNWQTGHWVFGVQGDMAWTGINTSVVDPFLPTMTLQLQDRLDRDAYRASRIRLGQLAALRQGRCGLGTQQI